MEHLGIRSHLECNDANARHSWLFQWKRASSPRRPESDSIAKESPEFHSRGIEIKKANEQATRSNPIRMSRERCSSSRRGTMPWHRMHGPSFHVSMRTRHCIGRWLNARPPGTSTLLCSSLLLHKNRRSLLAKIRLGSPFSPLIKKRAQKRQRSQDRLDSSICHCTGKYVSKR